MRLVVSYRVLDRPADMVFHFTLPAHRVPTHDDAFALCSDWVDFERGAFGFLFGLATIRSVDSHLVQTRAWSLDYRAPGVTERNDADVVGEVPTRLRVCLPTSLAPIVDWTVPDQSVRNYARSYMVGFAAGQDGTADRMLLNFLDRLGILQMFQNLHAHFLRNGFQMVHVSKRKQFLDAGRVSVFEVSDAFNVRIPLATRSRRSPWYSLHN